MKILLIFLGIVSMSVCLNAQTIIADFETAATTPIFESELETAVVDNPDKDDVNPSNKVGYYIKDAVNWDYVTMLFPDTMDIGYNNTLTFKIRASKKGRIFAKFWIGDSILIQEWSPVYEFMPEPNTWTLCEMDLTPAMGKQFTKLELAPTVDMNPMDSASVYFDDVIMSNPDVGDGSPKVIFTMSNSKIHVGDQIYFDGSASFDFDGEITSYNWDFGDGATASGVKATHTYMVDSVFNVVLTLTDNDNKTSSTNKHMFVLNASDKLSKLAFVNESPAINEKVEAIFQTNTDYTNPYNTDEVRVDAKIEYPDGKVITLPCFYFEKVNLEKTTWVKDSSYVAWMLRFTSNQTGMHTVKLVLNDNEGETISDTYSVNIIQGSSMGIVRNDANNHQYYRHETGEPFYPLGINIGWNNMDGYFDIIGNLSKAKANTFRYWHTPFNRQNLEWTDYYSDKYEGLGIYNQEAAAMSDTLLNYCEAKNIYMQLAMFQHGMVSENVDAMWETNPYNKANGGYVDRAEEFFYNEQCKAQTKKLLRYIIARWSYSKNLFAWEFFNEVQFSGNTNSRTELWYPGVLSWHSEMSRYIESIDPYNHIMTTSAEEHIIDMDTIPSLDNIQYHLYSKTLLATQVEKDFYYRDKLDNLSIINGEYGTDIEAQVPFDDQRHAIWNGIMTQTPRYMWLWEPYLDQTWANLFSMPEKFLKDEDFANETSLNNFAFNISHHKHNFATHGISNGKNFYGYAYNASNAINISDAVLQLTNIPYANYTITYFLPESGDIIKIDSIPLISLSNKLDLPTFSKGIAFKVKYLNRYELPIAIAGLDTVVSPGVTLAYTGINSVAQVTGTTLTYLWNIDKKPAGSAMAISNPTSVNISVVPDISGIYKLSLMVNDGTNNSKPDVVVITVSNVPVAVAGNDTIIPISGRVTYAKMDGSNSYDADGDELSFKWSLISAPENSDKNLINNTEPKSTLEIDVVGEFKVQLIVSDGISFSKPDTITITSVPVGIHGDLTQTVQVYPNPTRGQLYINATSIIDLVEVYDLSGRKIITHNPINKQQIQLNFSEITNQSCILLVKIVCDEKTEFKRVIYNK